jgi:hypothetical protein
MLNYASDRWSTFRHGDPLERESRKIAGPGAVDCGRAPFGGPLRVNDCVLRAVIEKRPFRARFILIGIDYHLETALVGAAEGSAYEITFMEGPYVPPEYRLQQEQCPEPLKLEVTDQGSVNGGRLTCFPNLAKPLPQ